MRSNNISELELRYATLRRCNVEIRQNYLGHTKRLFVQQSIDIDIQQTYDSYMKWRNK